MTKTDYILSLNIKGGESPGIMPPACTFSRDTSGKSHGNNIIIIMLSGHRQYSACIYVIIALQAKISIDNCRKSHAE